MKMYEKPSIQVIELQSKENIAAVPTTVYKGKNVAASGGRAFNMALSKGNIGFSAAEAGVDSSLDLIIG